MAVIDMLLNIRCAKFIRYHTLIYIKFASSKIAGISMEKLQTTTTV